MDNPSCHKLIILGNFYFYIKMYLLTIWHVVAECGKLHKKQSVIKLHKLHKKDCFQRIIFYS